MVPLPSLRGHGGGLSIYLFANDAAPGGLTAQVTQGRWAQHCRRSQGLVGQSTWLAGAVRALLNQAIIAGHVA